MKKGQQNKKFDAKPKSRQNDCAQAHEFNRAKLFRQEKLTMALINARSMKSDRKSDSIKDFVEEQDFAVIGVTETWIPQGADSSFDPTTTNHNWLGHTGRINRQGGGVAWGIRRDLADKVDVIKTDLPYSEEYQVSHITLEDLHLILVYITPGMPMKAHEKVFEYIKKWNNQKLVVMGDFNLPDLCFIKNKAEGSKATEILDYVNANLSVEQLVVEATRGENTLDLVFVSEPDIVEEVNVNKLASIIHGWDHHPVEITVSKIVETRVDEKVAKKVLKKANWELFDEVLRKCDWEEEDDLDAYQTKIRTNLQKAINTAVPTKVFSIRKLENERHFTKETKDTIELTKKLKKIYYNCPSLSNYNDYLNANSFKRFCVDRDNHHQASSTVLRDPKTFWNFVNRRKERHCGIPTLIENGVKIEKDGEKAELIKENLMRVFVPKVSFNGPWTPTIANAEVMPDITFSVEKTKKAIAGMKSNSAPGNDGIQAIYYKKCADFIAVPLTKLFMMSYREGRWPEEWLHATVTPLFKKGSRANKANYRGISLMLVQAKLMERSIKNDIVSWFKERGKWAPIQHAFRENRSTTTCLLEQACVADEWLESEDTRNVIYASIDSAKAFDAVSFEAIGRSLIDEGFPPQAVVWFLNGLENRKFKVRVGTEFSSVAQPTSGIMQGSILSPICWSAHMQAFQAIFQAVEGAAEVTKIFIYADDVVLVFRELKTGNEEIFQAVLDEYAKMAKTKSLYTHPEKSQLLKVGRGSSSIFILEGKIIPEVQQLGALGITLAASGKNDAHFENVLSKVKQRVFYLRKSVKSGDLQVKTSVWNAMMGSIIRYAYPAVKELNMTQIMRLQSLQALWMKGAKECPKNCHHRTSLDATWDLDGKKQLQPCPKHRGPKAVHEALFQEDLMTYFDLATGKMDAKIKIPTFRKCEASTRANVRGGKIEFLKAKRSLNAHSFPYRIGVLVDNLPENTKLELQKVLESRSEQSRQSNGKQKTPISNETEEMRITEITMPAKRQKMSLVSRGAFKKILSYSSVFAQPVHFSDLNWKVGQVKNRYHKLASQLSTKHQLQGKPRIFTPFSKKKKPVDHTVDLENFKKLLWKLD